MSISYFTRIVGFSLFFVFGFTISDFVPEAYGLSSETIGFPQGSHDQSMWEKNGPMPNNGLGSLDKPMRFVNNDSEIHRIVLGKPYDATYDGYEENSFVKDISPGETFSFTFTKEDTYDWHCEIHPWMTGNVRIGVWKPFYPTDLELLENQKKYYHKVWSSTSKIIYADFQEPPNPNIKWTAHIVNEFDFDAHFEYTKHIPCEYRFDSIDVIALMNKERSAWHKEHSSYVLNHEQRHFDIAEVVARQSEDEINAKYGGQTFACVSGFNNEIRNLVDNKNREAYQLNVQYDDATDHGLKNDVQADWNEKIDCMLEKRKFDSSCQSLTGTFVPSSTESPTTAPKYIPPTNPIPNTDRVTELINLGYTSHVDGNYPQAISYLKQALSLDPTNGNALTGIATLYRELSDYENSLIYHKKALPYLNTEYRKISEEQIKWLENEIEKSSPFSSSRSSVDTSNNRILGGELKVDPGRTVSLVIPAREISDNTCRNVVAEVTGPIKEWVMLNKKDVGMFCKGDIVHRVVFSIKAPADEPAGTHEVVVKETRCKNTDSSDCKTYYYEHVLKVSGIPFSSQLTQKEPSKTILKTEYKCPEANEDGNKFILKAGMMATNENYEQAIECLEKLLENDPDWNTTALQYLGRWYNEVGEHDKAIKSALKISGFMSNPHIVNQILGDAYLGKGEYKKAIAEYDRILLQFKDNTAALEGKKKAEELLKNPNVIKETVLKETQKVPNWVKTNAKWWSDGTIKDSDFIQGLQYLIKENLIEVEKQKSEKTTPSKNIPDWVKTQIQWWSNGQISESDFLNSVEFLMKEGIINIEELTTTDESFLTYTNNDFRFSIDYPSDWFVDDEFTVDENWAGIVWFVPVEGDYSNGISIAMQFDDSEFRGLTSDEYLNQLVIMLEDYCFSATLTYDGFKCKDFEVSDVVYDSDGNHEMYSVMYQTIDVFEDGEEIPRYAIYVEIPHGPDTYVLELTTEPFFIDSLSEGEFEELILGTIGSFSYN